MCVCVCCSSASHYIHDIILHATLCPGAILNIRFRRAFQIFLFLTFPFDVFTPMNEMRNEGRKTVPNAICNGKKTGKRFWYILIFRHFSFSPDFNSKVQIEHSGYIVINPFSKRNLFGFIFPFSFRFPVASFDYFEMDFFSLSWSWLRFIASSDKSEFECYFSMVLPRHWTIEIIA